MIVLVLTTILRWCEGSVAVAGGAKQCRKWGGRITLVKHRFP